ncbi:MAG TPA: VOC family protein [Patescibacteria group bacterium]
MLNLNSILLSSSNPKALSSFYQKVFQKDPEMADDNGYYGFLVGKTFLTIGPHDKVKGKNKTPERFMFNLETTEVKEESERIEKTGAKVIAKPYEMGGAWIATFADPDGNYFQLVTPWKE